MLVLKGRSIKERKNIFANNVSKLQVTTGIFHDKINNNKKM